MRPGETLGRNAVCAGPDQVRTRLPAAVDQAVDLGEIMAAL